jgi:hypothetical protein
MTPLARATCLFVVALSFQALGNGQEQPQPPSTEQQVTLAAAQQPTPTPSPASTPATENQPQTGTPPFADPELQKKEQQLRQEEELRKQEQSSRILGVVPQFGVTRQNAAPLTPGQKFHLFRKSAFDPVQFAVVGLQAGISQASNSFGAYGQGAEGYAKRYGAAFADQVSSNFFSNFAYPVLFKEDPRYFRLGEGSIKHRIGYALAQEIVCKTDKGTRSFNYSNVLGAFTAGGISNAYYPSADRGFGLTVSRAGIALLYGSLGGLVDEFWADIDHKLSHKKKNNPAPAPPTTARSPQS